MKRSPCTSSTARNYLRCTRRCIFTRSTGRRTKPAASDTPWSFRDAIWSEVIVGVDPDPANRDRITAWAKNYWDALHPYGAGGAYINFMMDNEGDDRIRATYGSNYERLAANQRQVRCANFFNVNQNIRAGTIPGERFRVDTPR